MKSAKVNILVVTAFIIAVLLPASASGVETPSSADQARVEVPVVRVPKTNNTPGIDGVMEEGEWTDATALSNFWYLWGAEGFLYLAPYETQLQVYTMYDDEYLYIAYRSPVYPEGSFLKARGRFPNVLHHPMYGILWDDKIELELRPYHDAGVGFQMGLFRWTINSLGVSDEVLWSPATGWEHERQRTIAGTKVTRTHWVLELAIPLESFLRHAYAGANEDGIPIVPIPQPDGQIWRAWFNRGIGGGSNLWNANDGHIWNTTNMQLVFDSQAVAFQINDLGPIMEDILDVHITMKNHNNRSEAVQLGFFVENVEGTIYSSFEDDQLSDGLIELIPGETRQVRLRKLLPGISTMGNTLWFEVRSAGTPAKILYRTRLVNFHAQDAVFPHKDKEGNPTTISFQEWRLDSVADLRPPRKDFEVFYDFSPYESKVSVIVDRVGHGASEEAQSATEARVAVVDTETHEEITMGMILFRGGFATGKLDVPPLEDGKRYRLELLLFDENRRIVGEENTGTFNKWALPNWMLSEEDIPEGVRRGGGTLTPPEKWFKNQEGLSDTVWEPFTPLQERGDGLETLNHVFVVDTTGLPAQIYIKPENRVLPLELQNKDLSYDDANLVKYGRGPQLRSPFKLQAKINGNVHTPEIIEPATLIRKWQSEFEYQSRMKIGSFEVLLTVRYDCDGSFNVRFDYGADEPAVVDTFEMLVELNGTVDMLANAMREGGMAGSDQWEVSLPNHQGIIWDSFTLPRLPLYYSCFVPWVTFGSGDRAFSYYSDTDQGWGLDIDGSAMQFERNSEQEVTWRVIFVNHPFNVQGSRNIDFTILTHPAKPKPENFRRTNWHFSKCLALGYDSEPVDLTEEYLKRDWHRAAQAPKDMPWEEAENWRGDDPPHVIYGRWRNAGGTHTWHPYHAISPHMDQLFEDKCVHLLGRQIRIGRRVGWWWDEYWPSGFSKSQDIAGGYAYFRDPERVGEGELPWQAGWTTRHLRNTHKRLARIFKESNVPQRQWNWSNTQANMNESFAYTSMLIEECGSDHRSFEVDVVSQYPISLYKYMAKPYLGITTVLAPGPVVASPGDDVRFDRQYLGLALLNDIGALPGAAHGNITNINQPVRLITILNGFGLFDDVDIEFMPFWRNQHIIRYGKGRQKHAPSIDLSISKDEPDEQVYISVYRRPFERDGKKGYKALIVIMNGFRYDVRSELHILQPKRIFGGNNNFTKAEALSNTTQEFGNASRLLAEWGLNEPGKPVLVDPEHGNIVELESNEDGELYGAVYVPRHDYRIFYAHYMDE